MKKLLTILLFVSTLANSQAIIGIAQTQQCELRLNNFTPDPNCNPNIWVHYETVSGALKDTFFVLQHNYNYTIPLPDCKPNSYAIIRSISATCGINTILFQLHVNLDLIDSLRVFGYEHFKEAPLRISPIPVQPLGKIDLVFYRRGFYDYEVGIIDFSGKLVNKQLFKHVANSGVKVIAPVFRGYYLMKVYNTTTGELVTKQIIVQ